MKAVRIENDTGIGDGTKVVDAETGHPVHGIRRIDLTIAVDELIAAEMQLVAVHTTIQARPVFMVADPRTGEMKEVARVEFGDGSTWERDTE